MNSEAMRSTLRVTKALADIQRVRIPMLLQRGELCVCQIIEVLRLAPSTVSKHLSILGAAGLVDSRKDGRWIYYRLPRGPAGKAVRPVLKWIRESLGDDEGIKQDARNLRRVMACDPECLGRRQRRRGSIGLPRRQASGHLAPKAPTWRVAPALGRGIRARTTRE